MPVERRGRAIRVTVGVVNWQQEEPRGRDGRRQLSRGGTSRVTGDSHARICERLCQERARGARCCTRDEGRPFGARLQEQASNSRELLPSNGGGGERHGKGVRTSRHVRAGETSASKPLSRPRNKSSDGIKTGAPSLSGKSMAET